MKILISLLLLSASFNAIACSCNGDVLREFEDFPTVMLVKVTDTSYYELERSLSYVDARFEIIEIFKGDPANITTIRAISNNNCSVPLIAGFDYLIYSDNREIEAVNACTKSREISVRDESDLLDKYRNKSHMHKE